MRGSVGLTYEFQVHYAINKILYDIYYSRVPNGFSVHQAYYVYFFGVCIIMAWLYAPYTARIDISDASTCKYDIYS